jgi:hypothetical protein
MTNYTNIRKSTTPVPGYCTPIQFRKQDNNQPQRTQTQTQTPEQ